MFCIPSVAMFIRTSRIVERLFSCVNMTLNDLENEYCQCISKKKSSYLLTNVYGALYTLIRLLLKLDIFFSNENT